MQKNSEGSQDFGTQTLRMQKALGKKAAGCKMVRWEGLVDARKAKLLGDFQNRGRISLSESAGITLGCILCHNSWNKRVLWLHISTSRTVPTPKDSPVLLPHTPAYPQCLLLPWVIGNKL